MPNIDHYSIHAGPHPELGKWGTDQSGQDNALALQEELTLPPGHAASPNLRRDVPNENPTGSVSTADVIAFTLRSYFPAAKLIAPGAGVEINEEGRIPIVGITYGAYGVMHSLAGLLFVPLGVLALAGWFRRRDE